jgi:hypothetical protein
VTISRNESKIYSGTYLSLQAPEERGIMQDEQQQELWLKLCQQAAGEQDTQKFMALIHEIDVLLNKKEQRLKQDRQQEEW